MKNYRDKISRTILKQCQTRMSLERDWNCKCYDKFTLVTVTWFSISLRKLWQIASPSPFNMSSSKSHLYNVEMAFLLVKVNLNSDICSCMQCTHQVLKSQLLLTCEHCKKSKNEKRLGERKDNLQERLELYQRRKIRPLLMNTRGRRRRRQ